MARRDPRYNALDVIRIVENNISLADKRVVFAWFFSLIPIKEPKVDVVGILLDLIGAIPVAGAAAKILQVSVQVAQVAVDIAALFQFEFEEQDVELAKALNELELLREEFREQREELLKVQVELDQANERIAALLSTQELLEDENEQLSTEMQALSAGVSAQIRGDTREIRIRAREILAIVPLLRPRGPTDGVRVQANFLLGIANRIDGRL